MRRPLWAYAWALPNTLVGLAAYALAGPWGGVKAQVVDGVLEFHGGLVTRILRDYTLLRGGAAAMTLGHVVLGQDAESLDRTRSHERVHVRQCERWGPLFLPAYLGASFYLWLRGKSPYFENPFEREAYGAAPDDPS